MGFSQSRLEKTVSQESAGVTFDQDGRLIAPDSWAHTYGWTDGNLTTDTITDGTSTWVKTFTYNADDTVATETAWVKQ